LRTRLAAQQSAFLLAFFIAALVFAGCSSDEPRSERMRVVATLGPVGEFVSAVGGDRVDVTVMVSPGASPHTYEPRPSQLREVSRASLYAKVGSGVEFELVWMDRLLDMNKAMKVVDCSRGVKIIADEDEEGGGHGDEHDGHGHDHGDADPHIWLSPKNARVMVENIHAALVDADPDGADYYTANRDAYLRRLAELDAEIRDITSSVKNRTILVYHPAWSYFVHEYGFTQVAIERGGKGTTPAGISSLVRQGRDEGIVVIFAQPEFDPRGAEVIAHEIGARVEFISPLGEGYMENMLKAARAFSGN